MEHKIAEQNNQLTRKSDVEDQLRVSREQQDRLEASNKKLLEDLDQASSYILELENKYYKAQKTSLELAKKMKAMEGQTADLEAEI